jgi:hypothetical protein
VRNGREEENLLGRGLRGPPADLGREAQVSVYGQMGPVVFERRDRDEANEILGRRRPHLWPAETLVKAWKGTHFWLAILLLA